MNGLDCLREELIEKGLKKTQTENKIVAAVLDIVANSHNKYTKIWEDERDETEKLIKTKRELEYYKEKARTSKNYVKALLQRESELEEQLKQKETEARKRIESLQEYERIFSTVLSNCETKEARDLIRKVQFFMDNTKIDTPQNNAAFINGLAIILSSTNTVVNGLEKLKKIKIDPEDTEDNEDEFKGTLTR